MFKIKAIFLLECVLCSVMVWLQFSNGVAAVQEGP